MFVIGRPGYNLAALNDTGFVIVHNLTDNIEEHPHRSLKDDPDTLYYDPDEGNVSCIPGEVAIDFPSTSGMSGGICLQVISCMETDGRTIRIARPYAVVWGSERIFEVSKDSYKKIINLKSLVSKIVV